MGDLDMSELALLPSGLSQTEGLDRISAGLEMLKKL